MRPGFSKVLIFLCFFANIGVAQTVNFQVDIVTHLNSANRLERLNERILAGTTGGLIIMDPATEAIETLTVQDGLYSHNITALATDARNNVILGTLDGMLITLSLEDRSVVNDQNLRGDMIVDVIAIADTVWALSRGFVSVYLYDEARQKYQFRESYKDFDRRVNQFYSIGYANKRIWLGSDVGLVSAPSDFIRNNLYSISNWQTKTIIDGLPGNIVSDILATPAGDGLYLATSGGVARYDFSFFQRWPSSNSIVNLFEQNGQLYGATTNAIFEISESSSQTLYALQLAPVTDFVLDTNNDVWVSITKRGLRNLRSGERVLLDGPYDNYIGETLVDALGRLWCSSGRLGDIRNQGIFLRTVDGWQNYIFSGGNDNLMGALNSSNEIMEDTGGNIWFGSWGGGVVVFDPELGIHPINPLTEPGSVWIYGATRSDTIPVATDPGVVTRLSAVQGQQAPVVVITDLYMDENRQSIWILDYQPASNRPLVEYRSTTFSADVTRDNFWQGFQIPGGKTQVHKITSDPFGDVWVATSQGLFQIRFSGDQYAYEEYTESDNLKNNNIRSLAADFDGYVWAGTESGLSAVLNRQVFDFREDYQPIGLQINDIFVDSRGNKWFATDKGLSVLKADDTPFNPNSWIHVIPFNSTLDPEQVAVRPNVFRHNFPSEIMHSVFLDESTGDVYLATQQGLAIIRSNPFASAFTDFEQLRVGPNPFVIGKESTTLNFRRLAAGSDVKILTANGQLVRELQRGTIDEVQWDGRNMEGQLVASGVYLYLLTTENGQEKAGKILVIRE